MYLPVWSVFACGQVRVVLITFIWGIKEFFVTVVEVVSVVMAVVVVVMRGDLLAFQRW